MTTWIGVDPGARFSGIVAREGMTILGCRIIDRKDIEPEADRPGIDTMEAITEAIGQVADPASARIAVEDVVQPTGHMGMANVVDLLRTAEIIGYLRNAFPGVVLVRPNRHGRSALLTYKAAGLVTRSEAQHADRAHTWMAEAPSGSTMRHARSAWDVAGAGPRALQVRMALVAQRTHR